VRQRKIVCHKAATKKKIPLTIFGPACRIPSIEMLVRRHTCLALGPSVASVTHTGIVSKIANPVADGRVAAGMGNTESHATRGDASRVWNNDGLASQTKANLNVANFWCGTV